MTTTAVENFNETVLMTYQNQNTSIGAGT